MLRVATIDNISAQAYRLVAPPPSVLLESDNPRRVYEMLKLGGCDAALLPVACLPELASQVESIGCYGIACKGAVHTVRLFAKHSVAELLVKGNPIFAMPESRTSIQLLRTLCAMDFGILPHFTATPKGTLGRLFIGEESLRQTTRLARWPVVKDLGLWWYENTRLPFVYARWVVRKDLAAERRDELHGWLNDCARYARTPEGQAVLCDRASAHMSSDTSATTYYQRIRPELTLADLEGLNLFLGLIAQEGQCRESA